MKAFRTFVLAKSAVAIAVASSALTLPAISHASPAEGVTCTADHAPQFVDGVLKCVLNTTQTRNSFCPPPLALSTPSIDTCRVAGSPPEVPAVSNSLPQLVGTDLIIPHDTPLRVTSTIARDSFNVTFHDFQFPQGAILVGNPQNGTKCPNGATARRSNDGRTLRCEQARENAVCLGVFALKVRNGKDICVIEVNGAIINQQPTVPSGQLLSLGWTLDQDGLPGGSNRDQWVRFVDAVAVGF